MGHGTRFEVVQGHRKGTRMHSLKIVCITFYLSSTDLPTSVETVAVN